MRNEQQWLGKILFKCKYKLTSKDKLVACYLIFTANAERGLHKQPDNFPSLAHAISFYSGLAVPTVQKSIGRLVGIGAISFVTEAHFLLEEVL